MLIFWVYHNVPFSIPRTLCNFQGHDGGGLMLLVYQNKPECSFSQASWKLRLYSSLWKKRERRKKWGERERERKKKGEKERRREDRREEEGKEEREEQGKGGKGEGEEGRKMCPSSELTCPLNCSVVEMPLLTDQSSSTDFHVLGTFWGGYVSWDCCCPSGGENNLQ